MLEYVISETQKLKRTFSKKLILIIPILSLILPAVLGAGYVFQNGAYNWWYTMFLPAEISIICAMLIEKDSKIGYRQLFTLPFKKEKIWMGKILTCSLLYLISCIVFLAGVTIGGHILSKTITVNRSFIATIVIFVTFLWQVPVCMILSSKFGSIVTILISIIFNAFGVIFAIKDYWFLYPSSISARLMCPILNILPNGLQVEAGTIFEKSNVIAPGIIMSILYCIIFTLITIRLFKKQEGK